MSTRLSKGIYWDRSWNPFTGCSPVGDGCLNCWAKRMAEGRLRGRCGYPVDEPFRPTFHTERLSQVNSKQKPQVIALCFMSDPFHEAHQRQDISEMLDVIMDCPQHTFIALTKRIERMKLILKVETKPPIPNLVGGVSIWDQESADRMIPILLQTNLATRIVSLEPCLGMVDMERWLISCEECGNKGSTGYIREAPGSSICFDGCIKHGEGPSLDGVIIGCESGPHRRETKLEWVYNAVEQAKAADVAVFVKQLEIDGKVKHDMTKFPPELQIRELPK